MFCYAHTTTLTTQLNVCLMFDYYNDARINTKLDGRNRKKKFVNFGKTITANSEWTADFCMNCHIMRKKDKLNIYNKEEKYHQNSR